MIVSGGHILAIDGVDHDFTLSGDGVKTPIGITEELLDKIRDVSGKLDTTDFESWSAQTEHWDVQEYSGGEGIKVENHIISVSAKYLTSGDLEPYATKDWVEDQNFLNQADYHEYSSGNDYIRIDEYKVYGYDWTSAVSAVPFKLDTTSFSDYSAIAYKTYLKQEDLDGYATSAGLDDDKQYAMTSKGWAPADLTEVLDNYYTKDQTSAASAISDEFTNTSAWALDTFFKTSEYFYAVSGTDSSSEYFNWTEDTLSASWKVKHFNLSFNYAVKPVSASPDFIYSRMQVGNTTIDDRHYVEGHSDTVSYNVSFNIYNADDKTYKFTFSAENDKLSLENLQISCIGFIDPRSLRSSFGFMEEGNLGNFVDSDGDNPIFVEKLPVG